MRNTPLLGIQVPDADDPADVPADLYRAVTGLESHTIITAASNNMPSTGRFDGMKVFQPDTRLTVEWRAASNEWTKPWGQPWGQLGYRGDAQMNGGLSQTGITTQVDIYGTSITFRGFPGRTYRAKTHNQGYIYGTGDAKVLFDLWVGSTQHFQAYALWFDSMNSLRRPIEGTWEFTVPILASCTIKLIATATAPFAWDDVDSGRFFSVEDIGPTPS